VGARFIVGILPNPLLPEAMRVNVPCAPVAAFVVGAVVYFICIKAGIVSRLVPMPQAQTEKQLA
jgi:hypothetical protein